MNDRVSLALKGEMKLFRMDRPEETLYERKNVICNSVSFLFARLLANAAEPFAGVWGLAVGAGGTNAGGWSASQQPDPVATQTEMVSEIKRKQITQVQYLDENNNPTTAFSTKVGFLTVLNETTDGISVPIREMGLIGGGTTVAASGGPSNMLTAPYFDPSNPQANTALLINYVTCPSFILPAGVDMGVLWKLQF